METFSTIEDKGFDLSLSKVFSGYSDAVALSDKEEILSAKDHRKDHIRTMIFFEKAMIKVKRYFIEKNRKGSNYIIKTEVYCYRFAPTIGMMKYIKYPKKGTPLMWLNTTYSRRLWEALVPDTILVRYLKYHDYRYPNHAYKNIIPMCGDHASVNAFCPFKSPWREPTFRGVLKAANLPVCRSMVSILAKKIYYAQQEEITKDYFYFNPLPSLAQAKSVWALTKDLDMTRWALDQQKNADLSFKGEIKIIKKLLLADGNKQRAKNICTYLIDNSMNLYTIQDSVNMVKTLIKEHGVMPEITGTNISNIHDQLSALTEKIVNEKWEAPIEWENDIAPVDGAEVLNKAGDKEFTLRLPQCANDLVIWGNKKNLSCCINSYRQRLAMRRVNIVGAYKNNELIYAITITRENLDIAQFKGKYNCKPTLEHYEMICKVLDTAGVFLEKKSRHWERPGLIEDQAPREGIIPPNPGAPLAPIVNEEHQNLDVDDEVPF